MPTAIGTTSPVHAEELTKQQARALFQEAIALIAAGNYTTALEKLEKVATFRRTPQVAFYIGVCNEKTGKWVRALGEYRIALADAQAAGAKDVIEEATDAISKLEPRIPLLTINRGEGADTAVISVDGQDLGDPAIGKPMPFDPGTRLVIAQAPGLFPFRQEVKLGEGEKVSVDVKLSRRTGGAVGPDAEPGEPTSTKSKDPSGASISTAALSETGGSNTLAWIVTGIGVAGLGASGYFFLQRANAISDLDELCGSDRNSCPSTVKGTYDDGKRDSMIANVALGVGVVGVATGVVLFATLGSSREQEPKQPEQPGFAVRVVPSSPNSWAGLSLDGQF